MESKITTFRVANESGKTMIIVHEPEYYEFLLPDNEEVLIVVKSCEESASLRHSFEDDMIVVRVLDHKSPYKVIYKGEDVFEKFFDPTHPFRA